MPLKNVQKFPGLPSDGERQVRESINALIDEVNRLSRSSRITELQLGNFVASEGQVVRMRGGKTVTLPRARPENQAAEIHVILETAGTLTVAAVGSTVNGLTRFQASRVGLYVFESNGSGGWFSSEAGAGSGAAPVASEAAAPPDATYLLRSPSAALPNARVATTTPTIAPNFVSAGKVGWDWLGLAFSAGTLTAQRTGLTFANSNNVSFGLQTNGVVTASVTVASTQALLGFSAGTLSSSLSSLRFADSNNLSWGLNGSVLTAQPFQRVGLITAGGTTTRDVTQAFWSQHANVGIAVSTDASGATYRAAASLNFSAGINTVAASQLSFSNVNGVSWGLVGSTMTAQVDPRIGMVSHIGGNSQKDVTGLFFSNASNVTWSLSTAAQAVTVFASVAAAGGGGGIAFLSHVGGQSISNATRLAFSNGGNVTFSLSTAVSGATLNATAGLLVAAGTGGGTITALSFVNSNGVSFGLAGSTITASFDGGIAIADRFGSTFTAGTLQLTGQTNTTLSNVIAAETLLSNNVEFQITNGSLKAFAWMRGDDNTTAQGNIFTRFNLLNSNGITAGFFTTQSAASARQACWTFSYDPAFMVSWQGNGSSNVTRLVFASNFSVRLSNTGATVEGVDLPAYVWRNAPTMFTGLENGGFPGNDNGSARTGMRLFPLGGLHGVAVPAGMLLEQVALFLNAGGFTTTNTVGLSLTVSLGLYRRLNSTRLDLVNSVSSSFGRATISSNSATQLNAQFAGARAFTFASSQWSTVPQLAVDEQYWLGMAVSYNTAWPTNIFSWKLHPIPEGYYGTQPAGQLYKGVFGVSTAASNQTGNPTPFCGLVQTNGIPSSVARIDVIGQQSGHSTFATSAAVMIASHPVVQFVSGFQSA